MSHVLSVMMIIAMLATLAFLVVGLVSMAKGGEFNKKHSNKLMRLRVILQAVALLFFILAMVTK